MTENKYPGLKPQNNVMQTCELEYTIIHDRHERKSSFLLIFVYPSILEYMWTG